jgi:MYXO-CTERM domain-containing protein
MRRARPRARLRRAPAPAPARPRRRGVTQAIALAIGVAGVAGRARAAEYHVSFAGNDAGTGSATSSFRTIHKAAATAVAGDTVYIHAGTYTESVSLTTSGTPNAWITFSAFPGDLPILDGGGSGGTGFGGATAEYIRVVGLVSRNWGSSGFGNGWVNDTGTSNGNWQFVNCIAEGNAINGITFYNATGLLIDQSIIAHNGNGSTSWSSGVNLFHVPGDHTTNLITRNVSFENIDISMHHSDGSGFILDQNSSGALFENNIGFRNGGSCIRINCPGAYLINNTCWHDGLEPQDALGLPSKPGELYFTSGLQGAVVVDNLLAASGYGNDQPASNQTLPGSNLAVNAGGATPFFSNPTGIDFRPTAGNSQIVDRGDAGNFPPTDIGFDPKCIKLQAGAVAWWQYAPDYTYIASVGGVAGCFHPAKRPQGMAPDIGAYEAGGAPQPGTSGGTGGESVGGGAGGATGGGAGAAGGATAGAGARGASGNNASGGSPAIDPSTGGGPGAGGAGASTTSDGAPGGPASGGASTRGDRGGGSIPDAGASASGGSFAGGGTGNSGASATTVGSAGSGCACALDDGGGPLASQTSLLLGLLALLALAGGRPRVASRAVPENAQPPGGAPDPCLAKGARS